MNRKLLMAFAILLYAVAPLHSWGQTCYSQFSISQTDGCAPFDIVITSHISNENPLYFYGDGSQPTNNPTHTYSEAGTYQLVRIITPSCASTVSDTTSIRVYDNTPPNFEVDSCLNSVTVRLTDDRYPWYQVWVNPPSEPTYLLGAFESGTSVPVPEQSPSYQIEVRGAISDRETTCASSTRTVTPRTSLPKPQPLSLEWQEETLVMVFDKDEALGHLLFESIDGGGFQVASSSIEGDTIRLSGREQGLPYCYRLGVVSDCISPASVTDTAEVGQEYLSEALCYRPLEAAAAEEVIQLSWGEYPENTVSAYHIIRDDVRLASFTNAFSQTYNDSAVVCGRRYCYQLEVELLNGAVVTSNEVCIQVNQGKPLEAKQLRASWEGDSLWVRWQVDTALVEQMSIYSVGGVGDIPVEKGQYPDTLTDFSADSLGCYYVEISDICGNTSISDTTCSMYLEVQSAVEGNSLEWTSFSGLEGEFQYLVEAREGEAWASLGELDLGNNRYVHLEEEIRQRRNTYRIVAQSLKEGGLRAYSNEVEIEELVRARVPDAFTPNQDGLNETFNFDRVRLEEGAIMQIYNRLGMMVYEGTSADAGWDGRIQDRQAPSGAYVYVVEGRDKFGEPFRQKGTFLLLRP